MKSVVTENLGMETSDKITLQSWNKDILESLTLLKVQSLFLIQYTFSRYPQGPLAVCSVCALKKIQCSWTALTL